MTYTAVFPAPRRRSFVLPVLPLVVVCLIAGLLAMSLALKGPSVSIAPSQRMPGIAERVRTSFGFVEVQNAVADATGMATGGLALSVGVMMHNAAEVPLLVSAAQFEVVDGHGRVLSAESHPFTPALLQPDGALDLSYRYVTSDAAQPFTVRFVDRTTRRSVDISLTGMQCVGVAACPGGHV